MAAELIKSVLAAEAKGRQMEADARKKAEKIISDAEIQADIIVKTSIQQAENQANLIISDAKYQSSGQVKQAEKLAEMRKQGARTLGQDKESSIVYGMPKVAHELGGVEKQVSLANMAEEINTIVLENQ